MKRMAAGRKRTIPVWLHLFENFTVNVMPIGVDDNKFGRYGT
jgi:hypothetical protein